MRKFTRWAWVASLAFLTAAGLSGCGGSDSSSQKASISKVYVMGDSLADVGTFGFKFTVQDATDPKGFPIWPQLVANDFGVDGSAQCNVYESTGTTFTANPTPGCTNYAIGGGRILAGSEAGGSTSPLNVGVQMAAQAASGNYTANDMVLIDGGGNDAADLVIAYLAASTSTSEGVQLYQNFLGQQLDSTTISNLLSQTNGAALAAGAYMQALADTFYGQIKAQALDKGATRVVVLNAPDITLTPRFRMVLAGVTAKTDAATAQALQAGIRQWISAFNSRLQSKFSGDARVVVVPFYADFTDEINNPSAYQLTNVTEASCVPSGPSSDGLPSYNFQTCTSAALDSIPGKTAGWWRSYAFSDGFHPTPYGHQLMADSVLRALSRAGWR